MKGLLFLLLSTFVLITHGNKALHRVKWAMENFYTEQPPFDGRTITLTFSPDYYSQGELVDTIHAIGVDKFERAELAQVLLLEWKKEVQSKYDKRNRRIKELVQQDIATCMEQRKEIDEANKKAWFFKIPYPAGGCLWSGNDRTPCQTMYCATKYMPRQWPLDMRELNVEDETPPTFVTTFVIKV